MLLLNGYVTLISIFFICKNSGPGHLPLMIIKYSQIREMFSATPAL